MMKTDIDLGTTLDHIGGLMVDASEKTEKHYPSFHYEGDKSLDLPEEGVLVVKFRKTGSGMTESRDGKKRYSCSVEVRKIVGIEGEGDDAPSRKHNGSEDALDKLMRRHMKEAVSEFKEGGEDY